MKNLVALLLFILSFQINAQIKKYKFEDLEALQKIEERPVMVFVTADWCSYCLMTKVKTFNNGEVASFINEKFYFVELNQNENKPIEFMNKLYYPVSNGLKTANHELAELLTQSEGTNIYPTTIVYNNDNELIYKKQKYLEAAEIFTIIKTL